MNYRIKEARRILLAPLDWGLGHATRSIPVVRELVQSGHDVYLAGEGKTKTLLQQEFPDLPFLLLPGYDIHYAATKWRLPGAILMQVPKILQAIRYEHNWLNEAMQKYQFDVVISDNRFGLYHPKAHCVFITHQLLIKAPLRIVERMLQKINYRFIEKFNECWVPDHEWSSSLAGELAHPSRLPCIPVKYIGPLSRFHFSLSPSADMHLLILLSGPEPQRSLLEQKMLQQVQNINSPVLLVRGLPGEVGVPVVAPNITIKNHLTAAELADAFAKASMVIGRCGYSTVMDIMAMRKKSILIPTPGQTEQEYLARHLMQDRLALCIEQGKFNLVAALSLAASFSYQAFSPGPSDNKIGGAISGLEAREL